MVNDPNPNNPNRADDLYRTNKPSRSNFGEDDLGRSTRLDNELQPDLELDEGPASGTKIALFALGIALVLGAVFYGLNNSSVHQAGTSSAPPPATAQNTSPTSPPGAPAMRDVTPRPNAGPGTTTGAAPAPTPPPSAPAGSPNNAPASK